jgi:hypothetical protein
MLLKKFSIHVFYCQRQSISSCHKTFYILSYLMLPYIFVPFYRYMTRRLALTLIATGWLVGLTIAGIPLIWNKWEDANECEFDEIFYPWYMVGVITPIFSLVWMCMLFVYCRIWREASKQVKQLRIQGQQEGTSDWKSVQVSLSFIFHLKIAFSSASFQVSTLHCDLFN